MGQYIAYSILFLCMLLNSVLSQKWTHYTVLDSGGKYHLYWKPPDGTSGNSEIFFKVLLKAGGYFGLGFSPNGGMPGSDIVTGWIKDGKVYFQDRYATDFSLPIKDYQQDYKLISAYENETFTVFEFSRKLDTCDENDMVIYKGTMRIIYAYSEKDPESDDPFYHKENRGKRSIMLLQGNGKENADLNLTSLLYWDVRSPDIDISSVKSLYWCKIFKSPEVSEKHHIVHVKPLIEDGHKRFVHHMALYECIGGTPEEYEDYVDYRGHECYLPTTPEPMLKCQGVTIQWAVGAQGIVFPEHVGLPIDPGPRIYYLYEIHYDNPQLVSGIIDNSALRIYYTSNLRKYDAGLFLVGSSVLPRICIPPGQEKYVVAGHSHYNCFGSAFEDSEVKFFAISLHAHTLCRGFNVRHFRENKELRPLANDKHYDFNYQEYLFYTDEVQFLPHDQMTVECIYNSTERNNVTLGGLTTKEEMCLALLLYYPRVKRYSSLSSPSYASMNMVLNTNINQELDIYRELGSYDWSCANMEEVQNVMRYSKHETQCYFGFFLEGQVPPLMSYPDDLIPYEQKSTCNST